MFEICGVIEPEKYKKAIKIIDDIGKISQEIIFQELENLGIDKEKSKELQMFFYACRTSRPSKVIEIFDTIVTSNVKLQQGIRELSEVVKIILDNGIDEKYIVVDPSIARGLDYYTGTVYETNLLDLPHLGSVCSGGRYEDLVGTLSGNANDKYPGCGISIGLTRLVPSLISAGILTAEKTSIAPVLIAIQDEKYHDKCNIIADMLRKQQIAVSVYHNGGRLKRQIEYAGKNKYSIMLMGRDELDNDTIQIKVMDSDIKNEIIPITDVCKKVTEILDMLQKKQKHAQIITQNTRQFIDTPEMHSTIKQFLSVK
jgi:histidyl-tRNA synthetase